MLWSCRRLRLGVVPLGFDPRVREALCGAMTGQTHRYLNERELRRDASVGSFRAPRAIDPITIHGEGADELRDHAERNGGVWNSFGHWYRVTEGRISKASGAVFDFDARSLRRACV